VEVMTCCCKGNEDGNVKHKQRDEQEKKALMTRLSRIEGHGSLTVEYQEKYLQVL
jgi:hypothetical protein